MYFSEKGTSSGEHRLQLAVVVQPAHLCVTSSVSSLTAEYRLDTSRGILVRGWREPFVIPSAVRHTEAQRFWRDDQFQCMFLEYRPHIPSNRGNI